MKTPNQKRKAKKKDVVAWIEKEKSNDDILKMRKFCEKHECKTCPYFSKKDEHKCFITWRRMQAEKEELR